MPKTGLEAVYLEFIGETASCLSMGMQEESTHEDKMVVVVAVDELSAKSATTERDESLQHIPRLSGRQPMQR